MSMLSSDIVIQQMFEDFENSAYSMSVHSGKNEENASIHKHKKKIKQKTKSLIDPDVNNDLKAMMPPTAKHSSASVAMLSSSPKSKSPRPYSYTSSVTEQIKFPISYDIAIAFYRTKLTPHEFNEIQNYEHIYYLGIQADKIYVPKAASMELYDDDDCFYRVVPRDHIAYRYEILERPSLGKGTFAQVVKTFDHKSKRAVAIKIVRNDRVYLQQSREELRILQVLRKRDADRSFNLVHIYDFFMFRNHMCISFELLGMNLYQVLRKNNYKGIGTTKILQVARCTLKCLELLYKCRIIHCDIKPENIMLKHNGDFSSVKVGDFGSSCYEQQQVYHYVQSRYYRAPEVILGLRYGPAIDMWSLGCVLGELSNGYPIFMGRDEVGQLAAIEEVLGNIPETMLQRSKAKMSTNRFLYGRGKQGTKPFEAVVFGDDGFKDVVKQMLEWDPQIRPSPMDIQQHPWIKSRGRRDTRPSSNLHSNYSSRRSSSGIKKSHSSLTNSISDES